MAIWLNYTHFEYDDGSRLLPNYAYLLNHTHPVIYTDKSTILPYIQDDTLLKLLEDPANDSEFEDPLIRQILLEAYPYEIELKFLGEDILDDTARNQRIISLCNQYLDEDYFATIKGYCSDCNRDQLIQRSHGAHTAAYTDRDLAVGQYLSFISWLLSQAWHAAAAQALGEFCVSHLIITHEAGISGVAWIDGADVRIKVWNHTYITLFHELTHFVMNFFDDFYPVTKDISTWVDSTKNNEGLSNFVALHFLDAILAGNTDISWCPPHPLFFSMYIDIYATLTLAWFDNRLQNYDLVTTEFKRLESNQITDDKIDFYYQRFFKFFHYDQHTFMYPKELMYYLGYNQIREKFCSTPDADKVLLLIDFLMSKRSL